MWDLVRLFFANSFSDTVQAVKEKKLRSEWTNIIRFRWQQFHGTYLGYRRSGPLTWQLKQSFYYPRNGINHESDLSKRDVKPIEYPEENR